MVFPVLNALAEPTRRAAFRILWDGGEHCVCELMQSCAATQSRMSRHMGVLQTAGLVVERRDARWVRYRLNPALPADVRAVLATVMARGTSERERKVA